MLSGWASIKFNNISKLFDLFKTFSEKFENLMFTNENWYFKIKTVAETDWSFKFEHRKQIKIQNLGYFWDSFIWNFKV